MPSPSFAKNIIARTLREIVDPAPSRKEIDALWAHFKNSCCYCGAAFERRSRKGHRDHIVSASSGGSNGASNLVLSCSTCNGDLKLEKPWREFLRDVCRDPVIRRARKLKIDEWLAQAPSKPRKTSPQIEKVIERTKKMFNDAVVELRRHRDNA
jgi:hypothetical protein